MIIKESPLAYRWDIPFASTANLASTNDAANGDI